MSLGNQLYLLMVLAMFVGFAGALAYASHRTPHIVPMRD